MRLNRRALALVAAGLTLGACAAPPLPATPAPELTPASPSRTPPPSATPEVPQASRTRSDSQGSVEFAVTPLNLENPGATLDFEVSMNTHSVDLAWDLAALAVLRTDTGLEVAGLSWPVSSGHHVGGVLSFPSGVEGRPLFEGASELILIIRDAGAAERVFSWVLEP
jgi:hypothetical protein